MLTQFIGGTHSDIVRLCRFQVAYNSSKRFLTRQHRMFVRTERRGEDLNFNFGFIN